MFYEFDRQFDVTDYNGRGKLRTDSILKIFQEAAIYHSASIGFTTESYMGSGNIWMHNKNLFFTDTLPDFKQKLRVKTWSRGIDKFKGYRNYEIYADGVKCITGSSIWIYLNMEKRRPVRPTQEMVDTYDSEDVPVMNDRIKTLNIKEPEGETVEKQIIIRPSDYDVNSHVSNVIYGQYIDTALRDFDVDIQGKYFGLVYLHEIKPDVEYVTIKTAETYNGYISAIYAGGRCACIGEVSDG